MSSYDVIAPQVKHAELLGAADRQQKFVIRAEFGTQQLRDAKGAVVNQFWGRNNIPNLSSRTHRPTTDFHNLTKNYKIYTM